MPSYICPVCSAENDFDPDSDGEEIICEACGY